MSCMGLSFHKNLGGKTVRIQLVLHTDLVLSLLHIFKFFYWKVSHSVAPLTFLHAPHHLASWSLPQNSRLPHDPVCIEGAPGPSPHQGPMQCPNGSRESWAWQLAKYLRRLHGRGGVIIFPDFAPPCKDKPYPEGHLLPVWPSNW